MNRKPIIILIAAMAACLAAIAPAANAGTPQDLSADGYSVTQVALGNGCTMWSATGYGADDGFGSDCDPGFQGRLDAFLAGHDERKLGYLYPAAVAARGAVQGKGYTVETGYAGPSFHVTGGCNTDTTTDAAGIAGLAGSLPAAAPCAPAPSPAPAPAPPQTDPGAPAPAPTPAPAAPAPAPACDVQCQLDSLQAQLDGLKQQVALIQRQLALLIQLNQQMPDADPAILATLLSAVQ